MSLAAIKSSSFLKNLVFKVWLWDAKFKIERIKEFISPTDTILDIGTGPGSVFLLLKEKGYNVSSIDIEDQTFSEKIKPTIYDGKKMPFEDKSFDTSLILTVLHHTESPEHLLEEAKRVCKNIIIIEDIYSNPFQKYLTYIVDSIVNLEFWGHPHSNKTDREWKRLFGDLELNLLSTRYDKFLFFFKQATYFLKNS